MPESPLIETFAALSELTGLKHGFLLRSSEVEVDCDREEALARLEPLHTSLLAAAGVPRDHLATGEQVHEARVGIVAGVHPTRLHFPATDALVTAIPGQFLGVWVADCGTVFFADPVKRVCGIAHSGKKGTELGIAAAAIRRMHEVHGSDPADLVVQLAPCIRPPSYEIDFAARIVADCVDAGVSADQVHDCGICTSSDPARYYSYRLEKGRTGRMFGFIGWA